MDAHCVHHVLILEDIMDNAQWPVVMTVFRVFEETIQMDDPDKTMALLMLKNDLYPEHHKCGGLHLDLARVKHGMTVKDGCIHWDSHQHYLRFCHLYGITA